MSHTNDILNLVKPSAEDSRQPKLPGHEPKRSGPEGFFRSLQESLRRNQSSTQAAEKTRERELREKAEAKSARLEKQNIQDKPTNETAPVRQKQRASTLESGRASVEAENRKTAQAPNSKGESRKTAPERTEQAEKQSDTAIKTGPAEDGKEIPQRISEITVDSDETETNFEADAGEMSEEAKDVFADLTAPSVYQELENLLRQLGLDFTPEEIKSRGFLRNLEAMLSQPGGLERLRVLMNEIRSEMPQKESALPGSAKSDLPILSTADGKVIGKVFEDGAEAKNPDASAVIKTPTLANGSPLTGEKPATGTESELLAKVQTLLEKLTRPADASPVASKSEPTLPQQPVSPSSAMPRPGIAVTDSSGAVMSQNGPALDRPAPTEEISDASATVSVVKKISETPALQSAIQATRPEGRGEERAQRPTEGTPVEGSPRAEAEAARRLSAGFEENSSAFRDGRNKPGAGETTGKNPDAGLSSSSNSLSGLEKSAASQAVMARPYSSFSHQAVLQQITGKLQTLTLQGKESIQIQLRPDHLGRVGITMDIANGVLKAQITVVNEQVKQAVEGNLAQLRETLELQGVRVQQMDVSINNSHRNLLNPEGQNAQSFFNSRQQRGQGKDDEKEAPERKTRAGEDTGQRWGYNTLEIVA